MWNGYDSRERAFRIAWRKTRRPAPCSPLWHWTISSSRGRNWDSFGLLRVHHQSRRRLRHERISNNERGSLSSHGKHRVWALNHSFALLLPVQTRISSIKQPGSYCMKKQRIWLMEGSRLLVGLCPVFTVITTVNARFFSPLPFDHSGGELLLLLTWVI
jgi:hypothetical protein